MHGAVDIGFIAARGVDIFAGVYQNASGCGAARDVAGGHFLLAILDRNTP
jgi:hypothetical protein